MKKTFVKMHALGNDFAIFDARAESIEIPAARIREMADRHIGIGFDQMVVIAPPKTAGTDAFLWIYNSDGGAVGACGNATRCIGALLTAELNKNKVILETAAGQLEAEMAGAAVRVDMGPAKLNWQEIPLSHENETLSLPVSVEMLTEPVAVNVGNPHAVFFVPDVADIPLERLGPKIEHDPLFPERVNVEVAQVLAPDRIRMRVWERGVGITQACGTGACAVAVAAVRRNLTERKVTVELDGGALQIEWRARDGHVLMTGPVALSYMGEIVI